MYDAYARVDFVDKNVMMGAQKNSSIVYQNTQKFISNEMQTRGFPCGTSNFFSYFLEKCIQSWKTWKFEFIGQITSLIMNIWQTHSKR